MHDWILSARNVRRGQFGSEPSRARYLKVPTGLNPLPEQAIPRRDWVRDVMLEAADVGEQGDIVFFVHGFNTSTEELIARHRQFRQMLVRQGFDGAFISFDWPSADIAINYLEDRTDAKMSALRLVDDGIRVFCRQLTDACRIRLHVVAHSMGAYVLREAFDDADDRPGLASSNWTIAQACLLGADVSSTSMHEDDARSRSLYRHCTRLTNYQNPFDGVLALSNVKRAGVAPRAGRRGLPAGHPAKAVNVNCGQHFRDRYGDDNGHSWYFDDDVLVRDLVETLKGEVDRDSIADRRSDAQGKLHLL